MDNVKDGKTVTTNDLVINIKKISSKSTVEELICL